MKGKKFLALAAVLVIAFAGIAWAALQPLPATIAGTEEDGTVTLSKTHISPYTATLLSISGYGSYIGGINMGGLTVNRLLAFEAKTDDTLLIAPHAYEDVSNPARQIVDGYTLAAPNQSLIQILVNQGARNNGTVEIRASNGDSPTSAIYTKYNAGTFAFGGTLAATNNNSLGQGPVGIQGRTADAERPGATFSVNGVTTLLLGASDPTGAATRQPFYLVRDNDTPRESGFQLATIYSGKSGSTETDLRLEHGLGEVRTYDAPAAGTNATDADDPVWPSAPRDGGQWEYIGTTAPSTITDSHYSITISATDYWFEWTDRSEGVVGTFDGGDSTFVLGTTFSSSEEERISRSLDQVYRFNALSRELRATRLVKTGEGKLTIDSNGTIDTARALVASLASITDATDVDNTTSYRFDAITGARHTGGTEVLGGTLIVKGRNATSFRDRFTGYLGAVWDGSWELKSGVPDNIAGNQAWGLVWTIDPDEDDTYVDAATENGLVHNPLAIRNEGSRVLVDRSQFFSYFNSDEGTHFTAKEFTWAGNSERPQVNITLNGRHSDFNGTLGAFTDGTPSSFDLVLHSASSTRGRYQSPQVDHPSQATLKLGNPENAITGETYVSNGVLSVAGANSIATRGTGNLYVGPGQSDFADYGGEEKAVFLGLADATFTNKTTVSGYISQKLEPQSRVNWVGALAAASGATTSYQDVTIDGAIEINPQAVWEDVAYRGDADSVRWTNTYTYPTWGGTVRFGGTSADYNIGGDTNNITQIVVSRGVLQLDSLPADADDDPFANVTIRETGTLSLGENVNDFGNLFDVQVDDDARIRVKIRTSDLKTGESAVKAGDVPALFTVRTIDTTWLGSGPDNKDRRLAIQLDLSGLSSAIPAGTWIKVVEAEDAVKWNNIHYLRDDSDTFYEDYAKVRPAILNNTLDLTTKVVAHVDENPYVIYLEFKESVDPTDPGTTPNPNFTFAGDSASTTSAIGGTITLTDDAGAPVASADIAVRLFHSGGVNTGDDANAIAGPKTYTTDDAGVITYEFTPTDAELTAFEAGATYVVKASADGYSPAVRNVTIPGGSSVTGSSSSGCDVGFGVFALLAATGAVTLLRKKD
jgi:Synergist-CTERM protein sorting domain-containing protein